MSEPGRKRRRNRPASSMRVPQLFSMDYGDLSALAFATFMWCVCRAVDQYDQERSRDPSSHARVYPFLFGRTHSKVSDRMLRGALDELCVERAGRKPLIRHVTGEIYELVEPKRWMFVRPADRVPVPRRRVFERDGFECVYCHAPITMQTGRVDHVMPKSRGGSDDMDNLATACGPCNARKSAKTPDEWLQ